MELEDKIVEEREAGLPLSTSIASFLAGCMVGALIIAVGAAVWW